MFAMADAQPNQPTPEPQPVGIPCPQCGCCHASVTWTEPYTRFIKRLRVCRNCGKRFSTRERLVEHPGSPGN